MPFAHIAMQAPDTSPKLPRLFAPDALRGLIMIVMALDHANEFIAHQHSSGEFWGGPLPHYSSALAFLTRFVTHIAAPGFFFLMGVGMWLFSETRRKQGWSKGRITGHFWTRGLILIVLQLWVENPAWRLSLSNSSANPPGQPSGPEWTYFGVLYALGGAMLLGSLLLRLRSGRLLEVTLILFFATELLTPEPDLVNETFSAATRLLLIPGFGGEVLVYYPILPWVELVGFGILFGRGLQTDAQKSYDRALKIGGGLLLAFLILRWINGFGNLQPRQSDTWIAFLNVVKYPPSISFTLLTMGLNLILLGLFARAGEKAQRWLALLAILGQAPLFFYVSHLYLYAALGRLIGPGGTSLLGMYPYWLLGLAALLPLCWLFGRFKQRQAANSLLRFF